MPTTAFSAAMQPHIPAWKRLGLKLKSAPATSSIEPAHDLDNTKRKRENTTETIIPAKKTKTSRDSTRSAELPRTPQLARKKSVTFTPETKIDDGDSIKQLFNAWTAEQKAQDPDFDFKSTNQALTAPEPPKVEEQVDTALNEKERRIKRVQKIPEVSNTPDNKPKKIKKANTAKSAKVVKPTKSTSPTTRPFLQYLKQYNDDKSNWKFNKNHQNHLLKNLFDITVIPSDQIHFVYHYIQGLQGGVRTRLRDTAIAIKLKDLEEGPAGFGDKMSDKDPEELARRQKQYEDCCAEYVATMTKVDASTKAGYEEGLLAGLSDFGMQRRTAKRLRAEQILANLAAGVEGKFGDGSKEVDENAELAKRETLASKARRNRKARTLAKDDTSSSDDSSDSDSSSDSGSDSSTSKKVSAAPVPPTKIKKSRYDDTSSSASSSSSESESESEDSGPQATKGVAGETDDSDSD